MTIVTLLEVRAQRRPETALLMDYTPNQVAIHLVQQDLALRLGTVLCWKWVMSRFCGSSKQDIKPLPFW